MSPPRQPVLTVEQEPFLVTRSYSANHGSGFRMAEHAHDWRQLLYACSGAMTVYADRWSWMIPPGNAVLIPAGYRHSIRMWGEVAMRSLYFPAALDAPALGRSEPRVISVTPLLRELVLRVIDLAALDSRVEQHRRLLAVLLDEMENAPETPAGLPLPGDRRALALARDVLAGSCDHESVDSLARKYAAGRRTLERAFRAETGMSFGLWRQKARMQSAARALAEGSSVTDAALDAGYASVSAFVAAFKKTYGCTPGKL